MTRNISNKSGRPKGRWLCQAYCLFFLLATAALGPLFYSLLAWVLFASSLYIIFRPLGPRFALPYIVAVFFLLPLALDSLADYPVSVGLLTPSGSAVLAAFLAAPLLFLLDVQLKQYAGEMALASGRPGSHLTHLSRALFGTALAGMFVALVIGHMELLLSAVILLGYLLAAMLVARRGLSRLAVEIPPSVTRVIAGNEAVITRPASGRLNLEMRAKLTPGDEWLKVFPDQFRLDEAHPEVALVFKLAPPLSGPAHPALALSVLDSRGLVQDDRAISPLELHVVPRARYAEWLARKYLREGGGGTVSAPVPSSGRLTPEKKSGGEYYQSRDYQPGDFLRDMDWRHTLKLGRLVVKERIDAVEWLAVLAVNLSVADAESADKFAYRLITTALTLAREVVPAVLVAYREEKVVLVTPLSDPRDILKQALRLVKDIVPAAPPRCLDPPDITRLKRDILRLRQVDSPSAQRLLELLELEYRAVGETAGKHPATRALLEATGRLSPPASVIMLSELNHDAEALAVAGERLKKRGFATYFMEVAGR